MQHVALQSSMIRSAGYETSSQTLEIAYVNGTVYRYFDVPEAIFRNLLDAPSAGTYLSANVIDVFRFRKV